MTNRALLKIALVLSLLVFLGASLVLTSAAAGIGASSTPLDTDGPDLVSADIDGQGVEYCFDEEIEEDEIDDDGGGFYVTGYNDDIEMEGDEADEADDPECVDVDFDDELRVGETTVAYVEGSTVEDTGSESNSPGTAALEPDSDFGGEGTTAAPDLEGFDVNESANQVTYEFDERIDESGDTSTSFTYTSSEFGVHQEDGTKYTGDSITVSGSDVTVQFSEDLNDDTVRVFAATDAVASQETDDDDQVFNPFGSDGEETNDPDLDEVKREDDETFRFEFDENLDNDVDDNEDKFHIYAEDGEEFDADEIDVGHDYVEAEFSEAADLEDFELPVAAVEPGAVEGDGGAENTGGSFALAEPHEATGFTDAPDLVGAVETENGARLTFDEEVASIMKASIYVIKEDRTTVAATGIEIDDSVVTTASTTIDSTEVDVSFASSALSSAVGVVLTEGAVRDHGGNDSAPTTIGFSTGSVTSIITSLFTSTTATTATPASTPTPTCSTAGAILGSDVSDVLKGTGKADVICSLGGNDYVNGRGGNDTIVTGEGDDIAIGGGGKDLLSGLGGNDDLRGSGGADTLKGGEGDDTLNGQGGRDTCRDTEGTNRLKSCEND